MTRSVLWLIMLMCTLGSLSAQVILSGSISDSESKLPLGAATIFDEESKEFKIADESGRFEFVDLEKARHTLIFSSIGYETKQVEIDLRSDSTLDVSLERLIVQLTAVEIAAKRKELFALRKLRDVEDNSIYAGKKTEVVVMELVQGNLASNKSREVYAQVVGLNIYEGNDGGMQLAIGGRGLDPNRTSNFNTRQNGYDISADVLGYPENYYTPPAEALSEIQIIRGASSLQYGTQFGGLINFKIKTIPSFKKLEVESIQSAGSYGFINTFNRLGINTGKWTINAFYNYKQGDGYRENSSYNAHQAIASIAYKLTDRSSLKAEFTYFQYLAKQAGGLTDAQFKEDARMSTRSRNWFDVDWRLYNLFYDNELGKRTNLTVSIFALRAARNSLGYRGNPLDLNSNPITALDERDIQGNYINPRDLIKGTFRNAGAEAKIVHRYQLYGMESIALLGLKYFQSDNLTLQGPGSTEEEANFSFYKSDFPDYPNQSEFRFPNQNMSFFVEQVSYINERLSITPGFRLEYIKTESEGRYNQVNYDIAGNPISNIVLEEFRSLPRYFALFGVGTNYQLADDARIYANISQNYRSVTFSDIRVVSPTFIVDENIRDESGFTADLGLKGRFSKSFSYDIGIYSLYYNDRIGIILDQRANRVRKNVGTAVISGVESLADVNLIRLFYSEESFYKASIFANTAFTYSQYIRSEEANVVGNRVEFIPTYNIKSGFQLGYKNFLSSIQLSYLSEQFTDVQNSRATESEDSRAGIVGEIPSYSVLDLALSYKFESFVLSAGINNLADNQYFTRRATGYPGPGIIPSEGRSFYASLSYRFQK